MPDIDSLWGDDFALPKEKEKVKQIKEKIAKPKVAKTEKTVEKQVKSKSISIEERLELIRAEVMRVLGKQKDNVIVIRDHETYLKYIDDAVAFGRLAVDTETNNSLDPITCKLMGLCLYFKGAKQAYIPVNHRDPKTKERLSWQLTEADIAEGLDRLLTKRMPGENGDWKREYEEQSYKDWEKIHLYDYKPAPFIVMHNGKFDYQVLKCTCGSVLPVDWDTMLGAKLLDENEHSAGLKQQYIEKIDPEQEKYSIDHLFEGVEYADVDPELFALYAATDSFETDKLYEWQMDKFKDPDLARVLNLANTVEMPLVQVVAEMEMNGVEFDAEYDKRLSDKYHKKLDVLDKKISEELEKLNPQIEAWKLTPEANARPKIAANRKKTVEYSGLNYTFVPKKKDKRNEIPSYWIDEQTGMNVADDNLIATLEALITKEAKSLVEQLTDPMNLASPTQLAILFYDILKVGVIDKKSPRGTGEDILEKIDLPIAKLLLERRGLMKLITAFIDSLPESVNPKTGRIHCHFNAYGAATGRFSSSEPNLQQIPSHNHELRLLFKAGEPIRDIEFEDVIECSVADELLSNNQYRSVKELQLGDLLDIESEDGSITQESIKDIKIVGLTYYITI